MFCFFVSQFEAKSHLEYLVENMNYVCECEIFGLFRGILLSIQFNCALCNRKFEIVDLLMFLLMFASFIFEKCYEHIL